MLRKIILLLIALFLAKPLFAATTEERLQALEDSLSKMQSEEIDRNAKFADIFAALDRINNDLQKIIGDMQTVSIRSDENLQRSDKLYRDIEIRLAAMEEKLKMYEIQIKEALSQVAPKVANDGKLYEQGLTQLQANQYQKAISTWEEYLKQFPEGTFAKEARVRIAETFETLENYQQAISHYQKFIEKYPQDSKTPEVKLKQASNFIKLGMFEEAKTFLTQLIKDYPKTPEAEAAEEKLKELDETKNRTTETESGNPIETGDF